MGHVGNPGLGLATFGDIDHGDEVAVAVVERDAPPKRQHLNFTAVGLEMPPVAPGVIGIADLLQGLAVDGPFILRPYLLKLHAQKRRAAVSIMLHGCVVDTQEFARLGIEHPHRHRVVVEQQPKRSLAPLESRDIRDRERENIAECRGAELEAPFVAVNLELIAVAALDDVKQSFDHLRRDTAESPRR